MRKMIVPPVAASVHSPQGKVPGAEVSRRKWEGRKWKGNLVRILSLNLAEVAPAGTTNFTLVKKCPNFRIKPTSVSTQTPMPILSKSTL